VKKLLLLPLSDTLTLAQVLRQGSGTTACPTEGFASLQTLSVSTVSYHRIDSAMPQYWPLV